MSKFLNYIKKHTKFLSASGVMGMLSTLAIFIIDLYRLISIHFPRRCRFYPSCSEYAKEAFSEKGFIKGLLLSTKRILKCHPFHNGGFDPVN